MTKNQQVLRKVAKFLYCVAEGAPTSRDDFKTFSDLCWLCVPASQRMDKAEIAEIKSHPWEAHMEEIVTLRASREAMKMANKLDANLRKVLSKALAMLDDSGR